MIVEMATEMDSNSNATKLDNINLNNPTNNYTFGDFLPNLMSDSGDETALVINLPNYLKQLLRYTGFDNIMSLSELKNEDIEKMEKCLKAMKMRSKSFLPVQ